MLQKIGIIGDVHAQHRALESALLFLQMQNADAILCTGDLADGDAAQTGDLNRVCALLQNASAQVVKGNHDRWFLDGEYRDWSDASPSTPVTNATRNYLSNLPKTQTFETAMGKLLLCHGVGENDMNHFSPDDYGYALEANPELQKILQSDVALVVGGHTHRRMARKIEDTIFLNAGTLRPEFSPCLSVLDTRAKEIQFWNYEEGEWTRAELFALAL